MRPNTRRPQPPKCLTEPWGTRSQPVFHRLESQCPTLVLRLLRAVTRGGRHTLPQPPSATVAWGRLREPSATWVYTRMRPVKSSDALVPLESLHATLRQAPATLPRHSTCCSRENILPHPACASTKFSRRDADCLQVAIGSRVVYRSASSTAGPTTTHRVGVDLCTRRLRASGP